MNIKYKKETDKIKQKILEIGDMALERVYMSYQALESLDYEMSEEIIQSDIELDNKDVEMEEECLKLLALYQPVAGDLRFLIAVIKINNDLERVGDLAVNIADRIKIMSRLSKSTDSFDYIIMLDKVQYMLRMALKSLVDSDAKLAREICEMDDEVDEIKNEAYQQIVQRMKEFPEHTEYLINMLLISRFLERVADHATNISEEVIYLIEGEIIRHRL